jgi:hypothetical protein
MTDERRALLTEKEVEILTGERDVTDNYRYTVASRVRSKIEKLEDDMSVLEEYREGVLLDELRAVVCDEEGTGE